jgi:undecaprenyl-diphosphatase
MLEQLVKSIILGAIQSLTEWLPVSSTGHLELTRQFLLPESAQFFDVIVGVLHVGTLVAVLIFFRQDIKNILLALGRLDFKSEYGRLIPLIIVGTAPAVVIGLAFGTVIENAFQTALPLAVAFILSGTLLYCSKAGKEKTQAIGYVAALLVGTAQAIAIIPGISRSGATISAALLLGIQREKAFKFSMLLSIPTIIGALALTAYRESGLLASSGFGWPELLVGALVALAAGYFALKLLWKTLATRKFHLFAFYCWLLGAVLIIFSLSIF